MTTYFLKEKNKSGCNDSGSVTITVNPLPSANWFMKYFGNEAYFHALDSSLADTSYFWVLGDGSFGKGHRISHLYPKSQFYDVSLSVTNANGCTNESDSTLDILYSGAETDKSNNFSLSIYPNPFGSSATLQYTLNKSSKVTIGLYDMTGRQIALIKNETQSPGDYNAEINAEKYHLSPGVYLLKFMTDDGFVSRQIVKL